MCFRVHVHWKYPFHSCIIPSSISREFKRKIERFLTSSTHLQILSLDSVSVQIVLLISILKSVKHLISAAAKSRQVPETQCIHEGSCNFPVILSPTISVSIHSVSIIPHMHKPREVFNRASKKHNSETEKKQKHSETKDYHHYRR